MVICDGLLADSRILFVLIIGYLGVDFLRSFGTKNSKLSIWREQAIYLLKVNKKLAIIRFPVYLGLRVEKFQAITRLHEIEGDSRKLSESIIANKP